MLTPEFLQKNSHVIENVLEHRFLFDLSRELLLRREPRILNISHSEVDCDGVDFVISCGPRLYNVQMKARSNQPAFTSYDIAESIWSVPGGCVIWMIYDPVNLEPKTYYLLGSPLPAVKNFRAAKRKGYRRVWTRNANHVNLMLSELAQILFPEN